MDYSYRVVFDRFPESPNGATNFVELEDRYGRSSSAGKWRDGEDGFVYLELPPDLRVADLEATLAATNESLRKALDRIKTLTSSHELER